MSQQTPKRIGQGMWILFWVILLALLYRFFSGHLDQQQNPNQSLNEALAGEVTLQRNRAGHYVAPGRINGHRVTFLLDTGATSISIPQQVADNIGLEAGLPQRVRTANGTIEVYATELDSVQLGGIEMRRMQANINPYMDGSTVLLGMSFMQHLHLNQQGDTLTLRY